MNYMSLDREGFRLTILGVDFARWWSVQSVIFSVDLAHGLHGVDSVNLRDRSGVHAYVVMVDCCTFGIICGSLYMLATVT